MPTLPVTVYLPSGVHFSAELTTDRPSLDGLPVLVWGRETYGPADLIPPKPVIASLSSEDRELHPKWVVLVATLPVIAEGGDQDSIRLLDQWREMCAQHLAREWEGNPS